MERVIIVLALLGIIFSLYARYIGKRSEENPSHKFLCDLGEKVSCGKVISSDFGKTLGLRNSTIGIIFYVAVFILTINFFNGLVFYLSAISVLYSAYLFYLQYFKIKNFCFVCTAIYIINVLILVFSASLF